MLALVDSGSERTLAAPGLARAIGVDLSDAVEVTLGIGGNTRRVRFAEVTVQLYQDVLNDEQEALAEWRCDVGFFSTWDPPWSMVLGRAGFFDQFTTTFHGDLAAMVVEPYDAFDERWPPAVEVVNDRQPRFRP